MPRMVYNPLPIASSSICVRASSGQMLCVARNASNDVVAVDLHPWLLAGTSDAIDMLQVKLVMPTV